MKKFTYRFRSIMVNHVEKVIPGTVFSKMVIEMDDTAIEEHTLELTVKDILRDSAWITNFFLSLMITAAVSGGLFTVLYISAGKSMEQDALNITKIIFLCIALIAFAAIWIFLAVKTSVGNKKRKFVEQKRGSGNWKIVDENDWDKFYRLLMIAKNKRESEKLIK